MNIEALYIYPIKSARSQQLKEVEIGLAGPLGDREWMLVDEQGKFISQRTNPQLATVEVFLDEEGLTIGIGKMFVKVARKSSFSRKLKVEIWNDSVEVALEPDLYSQALSQHLGVKCRLVRYAPFSERKVGTTSADWNPQVRFADSRPIQILNLRSLEDLNRRLASPMTVDRFRSNLVYSGEQPFEEDSWQRIRIGEVIFSQPKKCSRCTMITIDQQTGASMGPEPMKTLATYRREGNKVFFGSLWIPENPGHIRQGDSIEILS